jgi:hypothetical protein
MFADRKAKRCRTAGVLPAKRVRSEVAGSLQIAIKAIMIVCADADDCPYGAHYGVSGALGGGNKDAGMDGSGRPADQLVRLPGLTRYKVVLPLRSRRS